MSSNNNTGSIEAVFFACILGGLFFIGLFVIFVLALICAIATVVALASWNHPIRIGSLQVEAGEGRAFALRGLLGSLVLPAFMLFAYTVLDIRFVVEDMAIFYAILGYILGSAGIEVMNHLEGEPARVVEPEYIPVRPEIAPPPVAAPDVPVQPFSFAEWADEFMAQGEGSGSCGGCARSYAAKSERTER